MGYWFSELKQVLAFWFGESDEVTPDFIRQAAVESLQRGETFYSHNLGLPELRQKDEAAVHRLAALQMRHELEKGRRLFRTHP